MSAFVDSARALVDPVDGPKPFVQAPRIVVPLLLVIVATVFGGAVFALKWDAAPSVIGDMMMSGDLAKNTEQEIADKITTAWRTKLIGGIAVGVFVTPMLALLFAAVIKFIGWLFATPITYVKALSVAVLTMLPKAVFHLAYGLAALRQDVVSDKLSKALLPSNLGYFFPEKEAPLLSVLTAIDFFSIWGLVLFGMGFAAASGMRKGRAMLLAITLFVAWVGVFKIGIPAMSEGAASSGGRRGGRS